VAAARGAHFVVANQPELRHCSRRRRPWRTQLPPPHYILRQAVAAALVALVVAATKATKSDWGRRWRW